MCRKSRDPGGAGVHDRAGAGKCCFRFGAGAGNSGRIGAGPGTGGIEYLPGVEGTTKGTIIHEVLRGRDAATVLKEYGQFSEEHVRHCNEIRYRFLSSDLMKRVKRSYCEVPFVITREGQSVTGKIDRLLERDDGSWAVIDYKSKAAGPVGYAVLAEEYPEVDGDLL